MIKNYLKELKSYIKIQQYLFMKINLIGGKRYEEYRV